MNENAQYCFGNPRGLWLNQAVSPPTKYTFGRSRRSSGGGFHWFLVLVVLGVVVWIIWDYSHETGANRTATKPARKENPGAINQRKNPAPPEPPPFLGASVTLPDGGKTPPPRVAISSNLYTLAGRTNAAPDFGNTPAATPAPPSVPAPDGIRFIIHPPLTNSLPPNHSTAKTNSTRQILEAQIALARRGISSGSIDGHLGAQTRAAIKNFQRLENLPPTGELDDATQARLALDVPHFATYILTAEDLARLQPLGHTWLTKSQQTRLDYENALELVAEKFHSHPGFIRQLNPAIDWRTVPAGTELKVPNVAPPTTREKAAYVRILLAQRQLEVYNSRSNLIAHFPCSIARLAEKRPVGELHVTRAAPNPTYLFNPDIFPESEEAQQIGRKLTLPPGPNNPVGTVWIGLDRPGYGIHGTPRPEDVGRTESHGCFRLANWNAELLLKLVKVGTPVFVEP